MAQAYNLYVPLLEGHCPSVPRHLPPGPCGGGTGLGLTLVCSPGHSTPDLTLDRLDCSSSVFSPSIHRRPAWAVALDGKCLSPHTCILIISWKYVISFYKYLSFLSFK